MSIKTKFAALALATLAVTACFPRGSGQAACTGVSSGPSAQLVGTAIAAYGPGYITTACRCGWVRQSTLSAIHRRVDLLLLLFR